jgi:hypothetical protein
MLASARLAGHGITVVPHVPFALERHGGRGGDAVMVTHRPAGGLPLRVVLIPEPGRCRIEPVGGVRPEAVAHIGPGQAAVAWAIEAPAFAMDWPEGFVLQSSPAPGQAPGFDLVAPGGLLLYPRGPLEATRAPWEGALAGPDQRVLSSGTEGATRFVELADRREMTPWRLRHVAVPLGEAFLYLSLQAPEASADTPLYAAAVAAARSVRSA